MTGQARSFMLPLLLILSFHAAQTSAADQNLVLVANAQSPITVLTAVEARKLYLGASLQINGKTITPLRNISDPLLQEVFMQRVMYMAKETYERQILNRVFRTGGQRPPIHADVKTLIEALKSDSLTISYMWRETALATPGIKIVGE